MKRKNIAVILAGGSGLRTGLDIPKQFLKFANKTVLEHTALAFQQVASIDEIAIVAAPEYHIYIQELMDISNISKVKKILSNGSERHFSTLSAINAYQNNSYINFIIHDAVRPLISEPLIIKCIKALENFKAVNTAIPSVDTIIEVDEQKIVDIPIRSRFWRSQTPQCFHLEILKHAYELALKDPHFITTDDCKIVKTYCPDIDIHVLTGEESNIKLTYADDIDIVDYLFQLKNKKNNC